MMNQNVECCRESFGRSDAEGTVEKAKGGSPVGQEVDLSVTRNREDGAVWRHDTLNEGYEATVVFLIDPVESHTAALQAAYKWLGPAHSLQYLKRRSGIRLCRVKDDGDYGDREGQYAHCPLASS